MTLSKVNRPWSRKKNSYEMLARYVFPKFQQSNIHRETSFAWLRDNRETFMGQSLAAMGARVASHVEKKGTANIAPEILESMGLNKPPRAAE